jgi:hypothetical protein
MFVLSNLRGDDATDTMQSSGRDKLVRGVLPYQENVIRETRPPPKLGFLFPAVAVKGLDATPTKVEVFAISMMPKGGDSLASARTRNPLMPLGGLVPGIDFNRDTADDTMLDEELARALESDSDAGSVEAHTDMADAAIAADAWALEARADKEWAAAKGAGLPAQPWILDPNQARYRIARIMDQNSAPDPDAVLATNDSVRAVTKLFKTFVDTGVLEFNKAKNPLFQGASFVQRGNVEYGVMMVCV